MGSLADDTKHETEDTDDDESEMVYELSPSEKKKLSEDPYVWTEELDQFINEYCEHRQQVTTVLGDWLGTSIQLKDESKQSAKMSSGLEQEGEDPNRRYHQFMLENYGEIDSEALTDVEEAEEDSSGNGDDARGVIDDGLLIDQ